MGIPIENRVLRPLCSVRVLALSWGALLATSCGTRLPYEGKSVAQLVKMLESPNQATQLQGAYGLSILGPKASAAVPNLSEKLRSPDPLVRQFSAIALGKIGSAAGAAVPNLIELLSDADWTVRRQAALTLGEIGPEAQAALPALAKLKRDLPLVRDAAKEAIAKIGP
jgi:HEAT repeat protein